MRILAVCSLILLALGGCGGGGKKTAEQPRSAPPLPPPPRFLVGAVEDSAKSGDAKAQMQLASDSGFGAVALSALWNRGESAPPAADLDPLRRAVEAAKAARVRPILAVYQFSSQTPVTDADRAAFAAYTAALVKALPDVADLIVGNEPNLNLFWMPQFDASGGDAAATAYALLLTKTYAAVKAVRKDVRVIGGALSPRGSDDPGASRQTHSPTQFIRDLGRPPMDAFAIHPYGETPRIPPTLQHPNTTSISIADYPKLRALLRDAYGKDLPIVYAEYGVESTIPSGKASLYTGKEVVQAVDEATQARYYRQAIGLAACQPTVKMLLLFHVQDEPRLEGLQSGVRYADGSPKSSLAPVRTAAEHPSCQK